MRRKCVHEFPRFRFFLRMQFQIRIDKRSNQPSPHRALVIGRITRAQVAEIFWLIVFVLATQRTEAARRDQFFFDHFQHRRPFILVQNRMLECDREYLVRPNRWIVATLLCVDNVEQASCLRIPKTLIERLTRSRRHLRQFIGTR